MCVCVHVHVRLCQYECVHVSARECAQIFSVCWVSLYKGVCAWDKTCMPCVCPGPPTVSVVYGRALRPWNLKGKQRGNGRRIDPRPESGTTNFVPLGDNPGVAVRPGRSLRGRRRFVWGPRDPSDGRETGTWGRPGTGDAPTWGAGNPRVGSPPKRREGVGVTRRTSVTHQHRRRRVPEE